MDETDLEAFDRFIERHWRNSNRKETVQVNATPGTTTPRRGRPSKNNV